MITVIQFKFYNVLKNILLAYEVKLKVSYIKYLPKLTIIKGI